MSLLLQCSAIHTVWVEVQIFSVSATTYFGSYLNLISKYFSEIYKNPKVQAKIYLDQNLLKLKLKKECSRLRRCNSSLALNLAIKQQRKLQTVSDNLQQNLPENLTEEQYKRNTQKEQ